MELDAFAKSEILNFYLRHKVSGSAAVAQRTEVQWLVERLFPRASLLILAGEAKTAGKSTLMHCLATSVAFGQPFLGVPVQQGQVVLANVEDGIGRIGRRLHAFGVPDTGCDTIHVFSTTEGAKAARLAITQGAIAAPALFIVDPLLEIEASDGMRNENDPVEVTAALKPWREMVRQTGCTCILVHHYRKGGDTMRGSTAYMAASDGWIDYGMDPNGPPNRRRVRFWLRDDVPGNEITIEYTAVNGHATFSRIEEPSGDAIDLSEVEETFKAFQARHEDDMPITGRPRIATADLERSVLQSLIVPLGTKELCKQVNVGRDVLRRCLSGLEEKGVILRDGRYRWRLCTNPS